MSIVAIETFWEADGVEIWPFPDGRADGRTVGRSVGRAVGWSVGRSVGRAGRAGVVAATCIKCHRSVRNDLINVLYMGVCGDKDTTP